MIPKLLKDSEAIRLFLKFTRMARKILQSKNPSEQELKFIKWYQEISSKPFEVFNKIFKSLFLCHYDIQFIQQYFNRYNLHSHKRLTVSLKDNLCFSKNS